MRMTQIARSYRLTKAIAKKEEVLHFRLETALLQQAFPNPSITPAT
jgi:hypothetical protein